MKAVHNIKALFERRKELRSNSTSEEILLWVQIKNSRLGLKFRRQHSIGGYIVDFYCPEKNLVIEIDGAQHFIADHKEYDKVRSNYFKGMNIEVLRFTNAEINNSIGGVVERIKEKL